MHLGRKERLVELKKKRLEQSHAVAQRQMDLEKRRFYKQLDIDIRKQNLAVLMHSQTRLLDSEEDQRAFKSLQPAKDSTHGYLL